MAEINEKLSKLLKEVGEVVDVRDKNSAVWSLPQNKNALIVKHKALEKVSAHLGMWFDPPTIIESNTEKKIVSLVVQGYIDDGKGKNTAWSIGEVSPQNTSNKYVYAMAEKRAIDRVILKLLGVHGDFYSQAEIDEGEVSDKNTSSKPDPKVVSGIKEIFTTFLKAQNTRVELVGFWKNNPEPLNILKDMSMEAYQEIETAFKQRAEEIKKGEN
jgi:hypothetical protein|tara:strand:- start:4723 stop:5364 length:642 start_codon:yes stop_codon:yes gene_type:complete